jgi:hypothetical protein
VKRSGVREGDGVVIWKSTGGGNEEHRGVIAFGRVLGDPEVRSDPDPDYWVDPKQGERRERRVPVQHLSAPDLPLWVDGEHHRLLHALPVARNQGAVTGVTPEQWAALVAAAGGLRARSEEEATVEDAVRPGRGRGEGWGLSAPERDAVERHAMEAAREHYAERFRRVEDVSRNRPYDLHCTSDDGVRHVVVRGTTGGPETVLLTQGEVRHAVQAYPHVALFVLHGVALSAGPDGQPVASGGQALVLEPWDIREHEIEPIAVTCRLGIERERPLRWRQIRRPTGPSAHYLEIIASHKDRKRRSRKPTDPSRDEYEARAWKALCTLGERARPFTIHAARDAFAHAGLPERDRTYDLRLLTRWVAEGRLTVERPIPQRPGPPTPRPNLYRLASP